MWLFDILRLRQQAPTNRPPKGYFDVRISKASGTLVLVDSDGNETAITPVTTVAGRTGAVTIASADITDATSDGATNKGKVLKSSAASGRVTTGNLVCASGGIDVKGINSLRLYNDAEDEFCSVDGSAVTAERSAHFPDASGYIAVVTDYDDESAANTAEAANVVYYNIATGKFQITTA
jgi:hypothetical protein